VDAFLNQETFTAGETHTLSADLNGTATADFYVLLVLPDGSFLSLAPGLPVNALVPASTGVPLGFVTDVPLFSYVFTGEEALGTYYWVTLLVRAGASPTQPLDWLSYDVVPFDVVP
jgi:hypothetical protein